ncbi:hypothetical protein M6D81_23855 [Paenibacillus sp. J5C_2022]|uniref:hypothetical protein n=1 Tax=Paenibacillus sp. J5C2022 TaxID=2977129 RepID=UPI0021D0BB4B|nr:hypothetical protein [Paenibacillus sp. J5C2022]MCU6711738.1 hypothetical protein [Paenibacillus sp. J5C2022]
MTKAMYRIGYAARWSITIMMAISLLGCSGWPGDRSSSATKSGTVKYVIESDAPTAERVSVKLTTRDGTDSREEADIALPYILELPVNYNKPFNFKSAEISAAASASASFITCRIFYDDNKMAESTAKGNAPSVSCQGDKWPLRK